MRDDAEAALAICTGKVELALRERPPNFAQVREILCDMERVIATDGRCILTDDDSVEAAFDLVLANALWNAGYHTIGDLRKATDAALLALPSIGERRLEQIDLVLEQVPEG